MNIFEKYAYTLALLFALTGCASSSATIKSASEYFKDGEQAFSNRNFEEAIASWKKVKESYFSPELTTLAELNIADAQYSNGNYIEGAASYEEFRKFHPKHEKAGYALFRQGMCQYNQITGIDTDQTPVSNAVTLFTSFLSAYPDSELVKEVTQKLDESIAMQLKHELYVGHFYLRTEKYQAAIKRLEGALTRFPSSLLHDETLFYLGQAYMLTGDKAKARDTFNRLSTEFSTSKFIDPAKTFMEKNY